MMRPKISTVISVLAAVFLLFFAIDGLCGVVLQKQTYMLIPGKGRTRLLQSWTEYAQGNKVAVY